MSNLCGADHVGTTMWYRCTHFAEHQHHREDGLVREAIWRCFGKDAVQVFREAEASRPGAARPGKASKANR
ncbi:unnamed protein product [Durusdinium trenchii]|uniref:Uncharacterized protein n=1 Tax=Durusdinium trenchii TaxID=1381693 RepID=A0ABP0I708_9DINO